ncbi:MAG: VWA domain-containing protein [Planctomycetota bacterium]
MTAALCASVPGSPATLALLGFEVLRPGLALVALGAGVIVLAAGLMQRALRRRDLARLADAHLLVRLFPGRLPGRLAVRIVLGLVATLLLALALLGPVRGFTLVPLQRRGVDLVIALDTSRSMLAEDNEPNRLARAKKELDALLTKLEGERVGLVAFAGTAWDVAPLTRDLDTVRYFMKRLSPDDNRAGGTDLGKALEFATRRLGEAGDATEVILLVTDGEDLGGAGLTVAREAAARGAKVHVLGMGTDGGAKIPDGRGRFIRDENGADVVTKLEDATLRQIADATGGVYMRAHGSVLPLERLYDLVISKEQGRDVVDGKERIPQDRYQWPLALALALMLAELALRERRGIEA